MESTDEERRRFGQALAQALDGRTHGQLGAEVGRLLNANPVSPSAVSQWVSGKTEPERSKVFAAEKVLGLKPGTLSRIFGYLPANAKAQASVVDAIDADVTLAPRMKEVLRAAYRAAQ